MVAADSRTARSRRPGAATASARQVVKAGVEVPPRQRHAHRRIDPRIKVDVAIGMPQRIQDGETASVRANPAKSVRVGYRRRRPGRHRRTCGIPILQAAQPQLHPCIGCGGERRRCILCFLVHRHLHTRLVDNVHPGGRPALADQCQPSLCSSLESCVPPGQRLVPCSTKISACLRKFKAKYIIFITLG
jgi:hypothetical protein